MSRKTKSSDDSVYQMLDSERARCEAVLERIDRELSNLPKGSLCQRRVVSNGKVYLYPCLKYRDGSEVKLLHVSREKAEEVQAQVERKKRLKQAAKETKVRLATLRTLLARNPYRRKEER
ncbi:hypothetical protein KP003_06850 [Geomonas nitrogeniifigens]|uniref:Uncharacterized protein n=1 Tax=Geomonas diazotrophica TaxID=2843197 RepID=A0ABX8JLV9_9BACT|nr:hypothetical protein [Geomonas nitrogeniifigens]QWV98961.1 hypothetical protein KP005_06690 [Geomonas nitrogeniifigens]QXE88110.1 hypothetical protein KP003_06850 [Geomonas nitrogeniifigens]